jgi:hypothetical protein
VTFLGWELNPDLSIQRPTLYRLSHLVLPALHTIRPKSIL